MSKKKTTKRKLTIVNPNAAGIDIGANSNYVCVPEDRDKLPVRKFGCFTRDLHALADWLKACKVTTVAMESTGVYWIPLFQVLEERGFEVKLVNARDVKNVPGRKTDVEDCRWLQQLHSYGLLRGSFRPENEICVLRSYIRHRDSLIQNAGTHILRMQKALTQMNIRLHNVISDITGLTGMRIIKAILAGERDTLKLAKLRREGIKSDEDTIAKSLEGDYRTEHLYVLKQELEFYEFYQQKLAECDEQIKSCYEGFEQKAKTPLNKHSIRRDKNNPRFDLKQELYNMTGIDFTVMPGLEVLTVQTIISEVGINMEKWPSEKHFASWLGLCPANKITGEKVFSTRSRKVINKASIAFRLAAWKVGKSKTALGAFYRRMKSKVGAPKAITATARKLACLFYRLLRYGQSYVEQGMDYYEKQYAERVVKNLEKRAKELGFALVKDDPLQGTVS
jgi:transposase